jgi:hypothetical protein
MSFSTEQFCPLLFLQLYLISFLAKIAQTQVGDLEQFLPGVWNRKDAAEPASADYP